MQPKTLAKVGVAFLGLGVVLWYGVSYLLNAWMLSSQGLWIWYYGSLGQIAQYICLCVAGAGLMLVLRSSCIWLAGRFWNQDGLRMVPDMDMRHVLPMKRLPPMRLIHETPNLGLMFGWVLVALLFLHMNFYKLTIPRGLPIEFLTGKAPAWLEAPKTESLGVYVDAHNEFLVNGQKVEREKLREKLSEELGRRVVWIVYVEADVNSTYRETVYAIDTIEGLGARPVWITPRMRDEWKKRADK